MAEDFRTIRHWWEKAAAKQSATARRWSEGEQAVAQKAAPETSGGCWPRRTRIIEAKFGHMFLICATGKSSEEILKNLQ